MDVVGTFVVVVRIRRARRPPQVRAFEVHIVLPAGQWAAPSVLDVVASVLTLVRSHPRAQPRRPGRPGHDDGQRPRGGVAAAPRRGPQLRRPHHPYPAGARRRPGRLPGHAGCAAPSGGAAGCARCQGSPARGPG
nr:PREDICTED: tumor suppressor ARF-like isoform X3 [Rhinolophus sinicus]